MKRTVTWVVIVLAGLVVLIVVALAAVPYVIDTPRIQALIASSATQALGRPLKFSGVTFSVFPLPSMVLEDLEVAEDPAFDGAPFVKLKQAEVRLRLWPLLRLRVEFGDVVLKEPTVTLIRRPDGQWNIASLGPGGEPRASGRPRSGGGAVEGGPVALTVLGSRITVDDGVLTYESRTAGRASRYRLDDLDLTLKPGPGPLAFEGEARLKPGDLQVKISDGTVGIHEARTLTEASLRGRLRLEGQDARELMAGLMGPEPVIAGGLKGALALGGTVGKPRASGDIELTSVTVTRTNDPCPEPKRRTLVLGSVKLNAAWEPPRFTARPVTTSLAQGSITANLTATLNGAGRVELSDLGIRGLRVEQILVDFLCQGYAVTGPLDLTGTAAARLDQPAATLSGRGQLRLGPGKVVGSQALALLERVIQISGVVSALLTGEAPTGLQDSTLDYDSITATYTMTNSVVSTRDLVLTAGNLKVTAAGTYGLATGAMNLDLAIATSRRELRARVTGNAAAPQVALAPGRRLLTPREHEKIGEGLRELLEKFR